MYFSRSSLTFYLSELKYGKTKAIDAQIPTPQAISSTLAALPSGPTSTPSKPIPPKPIPKAANGSTNTSSAGAETPAEHAASSATGTPSKSVSKLYVPLPLCLAKFMIVTAIKKREEAQVDGSLLLQSFG